MVILFLVVVLLLVGSVLVFVFPPVGLGLFVFSGTYTVGRFETYLGGESEATVASDLWIAPIILVVLCLSLAARPVLRKRSGGKLSSSSALAMAFGFAFGVVLVAGCLYSPGRDYGITKALEYVFLIQFAFLAPILVADNAKRYGLLLLTLFLVPLFFAFLGLTVAVMSQATAMTRVAVLGGGANAYARFMVVGMFAGAAFLLTAKRALLRLGLLLGVVLLFLAFLIAGSRGALLALIPSAVFFVFVAVVTGARRGTRARTVVGGLVVVVGVALLVLVTYGRLSLPNAERYAHLWEELPGSESVSTRMLFWQDAVTMFASRPLAGYGTGSFAPVAVGVESGVYPHNIVLEVAAETGVIGLLLFGGFIVLIVRTMIRLLASLRSPSADSRLRAFALATAAAFVFYFVGAQFSGDLYDGRFIWLLGGMILALEAMVGRDGAYAGAKGRPSIGDPKRSQSS